MTLKPLRVETLENGVVVGYVDDPMDWDEYVTRWEYTFEDIGAEVETIMEGWH